MASILGTALSGLNASQVALDTISHNIANVNTENYSRQSVLLDTRAAQYTGSGYVGQGVDIAAISRNYDQFINQHLTLTTSAYNEADTLYTLSAQVDSLLSGDSTSLSPTLTSFFSAVNEVADDPTSLPVRQVMLTEGKFLTQQFNSMVRQFSELRDQNNNQIDANLAQVNAYAQSIAEINAKLVQANDGATANDLLDQRDNLVAKIAEKVSVSSIVQKDGSLSVFIGSGQSLVLGNKAATLSLASSNTDVAHKNILLDGQDVTKQITGGDLAGQLRFRDEILDPAQQQIGLLAAGAAVTFNALHSGGYDLKGTTGANFFNIVAPAVVNENTSQATITTSYNAQTIGQLSASDYRLNYDGSNFQLTRLSDNTTTSYSGAVPLTINGPGFDITISGTLAANDSFLIRPTYNAAGQIDTALTDPNTIAASASADTVPGDNTVALKLAALEHQEILLAGKATFNEVNGQLVSKVGTLTSSAKVNSSAQEAIFNQAKQTRENLSGVNLDEEAANLIRFQQSYQAAAQAINTASTIFDTLLGVLG